MNKTIDPKKFGLHPSTKIEQHSDRQFTIRIDRKSRIIMKDGEIILKKASKIKELIPGAVLGVSTTAPVCTKTKRFLEEHDIAISET